MIGRLLNFALKKVTRKLNVQTSTSPFSVQLDQKACFFSWFWSDEVLNDNNKHIIVKFIF